MDPSPSQAAPVSAAQLPPTLADPKTAAAAAPSESAGRLLPELPVRNESEILQTARMLAHQNGGQARIVLHPPQLGELGIRLIITHDVASLSLTADHRAVAQLLARHLPELRAVLDTHDIRLERVDVDVRGDAQGDSGRAPRREAPDGRELGSEGSRGGLRSGHRGVGGPPLALRGVTPRWAHLGTVDLRI
ncbi:MAG: flagellar hook-length control protein FliK [Myxococcota bacterium]